MGAGDLGDMHRQLAHAPQVDAHAQARDDRTEVGGDRLFPREEVQREPVERDLLALQVRIRAEHRLGQPDIGVQQCLRRIPHRRVDEGTHLVQTADKLDKPLVVQRSCSHTQSCAAGRAGQPGERPLAPRTFAPRRRSGRGG